jgi:acyl-CoA synthetase (AMP-forming)/AMP-acid ligase II
MPLFHVGGQGIALMPALLAGNSIAFLEEFSASGFLEQARDTRATVGFGVDPMGMAMLAAPATERDQDHSLRLGVWVPMPIPSQDAYAERFGMPVISETYGQTECNPITGSPIDRRGRGAQSSLTPRSRRSPCTRSPHRWARTTWSQTARGHSARPGCTSHTASGMRTRPWACEVATETASPR